MINDEVKSTIRNVLRRYNYEVVKPDVDEDTLCEMKKELYRVTESFRYFRVKEIFHANRILLPSPFLYEEEVRKAAMSLPSKAVEWSDAMYKHPRIGLTGEEGNAMRIGQYKMFYNCLTTWDNLPWER